MRKRDFFGEKGDMQNGNEQKLEEAPAKIETNAIATLKATKGLMNILRKLNSAARTGHLQNLHSAMASADTAMPILRQQFANTKEGWPFNDELT